MESLAREKPAHTGLLQNKVRHFMKHNYTSVTFVDVIWQYLTDKQQSVYAENSCWVRH